MGWGGRGDGLSYKQVNKELTHVQTMETDDTQAVSDVDPGKRQRLLSEAVPII